ncbi:MAG: hypothetical protein V1678_04770, partial [Candidatus Aenigmatarchaeota archaeon]
DNKGWIKIPVASSEENTDEAYEKLLITFNELKKTFPRIAVRIFVSHIQVTPHQEAQLRVISDNLRKDDIILLDVIAFEGVEQPVLSNVKTICSLLPAGNEKHILNAFDIRTNRGEVHNYGPLLAKHLGFNGFGDFATSLRYEPKGGRQGKKIIRYYVGDSNNKLVHFVDTAFSRSLSLLKASAYWTQAIGRGHNKNCAGCLITATPNESMTFWKKFRILHYIFSILNDTLPHMNSHKNPQDIDTDGYANLYNKGSIE